MFDEVSRRTELELGLEGRLGGRTREVISRGTSSLVLLLLLVVGRRGRRWGKMGLGSRSMRGWRDMSVGGGGGGRLATRAEKKAPVGRVFGFLGFAFSFVSLYIVWFDAVFFFFSS